MEVVQCFFVNLYTFSTSPSPRWNLENLPKVPATVATELPDAAAVCGSVWEDMEKCPKKGACETCF